MKCLDRVTIQEYIDNEMDDLQSEQVRSHLSECEKCRELYTTALDDKRRIESLLSQIDDKEESIKIPEFNHEIKRRSLSKAIGASLFLKIAAGTAIILGLFWLIYSTYLSPEQPELSEADLVALELLRDIGPNKAWHNTHTVFVITNEKGEVIQSYLSNSN